MLQHALAGTGAHPLAGTAARFLWLLPLLPLAGFVINGLISLLSAYRRGPADPSHPSDAAHGAAHGHEGIESDAHPEAHDTPSAHPAAWLVSLIGPLAVGLAFVLAVVIFVAMRSAGADALHTPFVQRYGSWMPVGDLQVDWAFQLDQLSMLMVLVITGVGTLIHIFSVGYMKEDPGYPRYFAYLNLFVVFMLLLVLGANYPVLFIGWEGVGLCSYLLIGFWFEDKANADAGKKAFIVNRIGDFGFLIAMFLLFANLGTLDFTGVAARAGALVPGGAVVTAICLFLFLGCTGKSAQIPLYIWLPDAMAGPTPVSALIHAATMVTAGVYLVARSSFLFAMAPVASLTVAVVGAVTAIFAASIGLKQWDIKKVLAYSTVSQLGYMFIGVGVGAYVAGMFHLVTHAFFKALLFLGSGSVIYAMHAAYHHTHRHDDAQDMRNMGGLRRYLPVTWILMWIATLAIAGIPPFAGFFSKDEILGSAFARAQGSTLADAHWLGLSGSTVLYGVYALGLAGALITAIYMTRMMLYTFHGPNRTGEAERSHLREAPWSMTGPLVALGILSIMGGWLNVPELLHRVVPIGPTTALERWLEPVVGGATASIAGAAEGAGATHTEAMLILVAIAVAVAGIVIAIVALSPARLRPKAESPESHGFGRVLEHKYYVDEAYDAAVIQPVVQGSRFVLWRFIDAGIIDGLFVNGSAVAARIGARIGSWVQSGQVGTYAWAIVVGVLAVLGAFTLR
ncbi:MAG TPA: NADH-quinone oxidoreductase subunit L [Gemmatimonadaceae bacterium]|nr:NADH-quinone oxidoreductase subunit L [Gemmatimonadaceae bacterium]